MSQINLNMRDLAHRLIDHEAKREGTAGDSVPAGFHVCEKLRPHLATLMGNTGFRVLLSRTLQMAREADPWLNEVQVTADGLLETTNGSKSKADPKIKTKGSVGLVTQLFLLLTAFIGEDLTVRIVLEAWPNLSSRDSGSDSRNIK
jgi:hypothetical protein